MKHRRKKVSKLATRSKPATRNLSLTYQEAEVRKDFIDKLCITLG
jgi:hypothetical protein